MAKGKKGNISDKQRKAMHASMRARGVAMGKPPQGMDADLNKSANVFPKTPANVKEWSKPGGSRRMDIEGIDTKPKVVMQITFDDVTPDKKDMSRLSNEDAFKEYISDMNIAQLEYIKDQQRAELGKMRVSAADRERVTMQFEVAEKMAEKLEKVEIKKMVDVVKKSDLSDKDKQALIGGIELKVYKTVSEINAGIKTQRQAVGNGFKADSSLISHDAAMQAHRGTSWKPDERGKAEIENFTESVNNTYQNLLKLAKSPEQRVIVEREIIKYQAEYAQKENARLRQHGGLLSTMIAGRSNFSAKQAQKRSDSYDKTTADIRTWKEKRINRIKKDIKQQAIYDGGGEIAIMQRKIDDAEDKQKQMKTLNSIMRAKKLSDDDKIKKIMADLGFKENTAKNLIKNNFSHAPYELTNNNANIKRMTERVKTMERMDAKPTSTVKFSGGEIIDNSDEDRVQIDFGDKPDETMRDKLKGEGWRWSPYNGVWQRKRTDAAMSSARRIVGA